VTSTRHSRLWPTHCALKRHDAFRISRLAVTTIPCGSAPVPFLPTLLKVPAPHRASRLYACIWIYYWQIFTARNDASAASWRVTARCR